MKPEYFEIDNMSTGYLEIVKWVRENGRKRSPRGMNTREIPNALIRLDNPKLSHPQGIGRQYSKAIIAAEAVSLVAGVSDPNLMVSVGSAFTRFLDGGSLHGAYGPRIRGQLENVVERLKTDPDTRQAVLQIWDARYDQAGWVPKDLPCTLSLGYAIYDGYLEATTTMRSNDVWLGLAHDIPMFTALQLTIADAIGVPAGAYHHHAYSLHAYERDFPAMDEQLHPLDFAEAPLGGGIQSRAGIYQGQRRAREILEGTLPAMASPAERWYHSVLEPHVGEAALARNILAKNTEGAAPALITGG